MKSFFIEICNKKEDNDFYENFDNNLMINSYNNDLEIIKKLLSKYKIEMDYRDIFKLCLYISFKNKCNLNEILLNSDNLIEEILSTLLYLIRFSSNKSTSELREKEILLELDNSYSTKDLLDHLEKSLYEDDYIENFHNGE